MSLVIVAFALASSDENNILRSLTNFVADLSFESQCRPRPNTVTNTNRTCHVSGAEN